MNLLASAYNNLPLTGAQVAGHDVVPILTGIGVVLLGVGYAIHRHGRPQTTA